MQKSSRMGMNRTGIDMSPRLAKEMIRDAQELTQGGVGDGKVLERMRLEYIEDAEAIGAVPIPGSLKGAVKAGLEKLSGRNPEILINKLGERLAFERSGVRLYEGVIAKCEARRRSNASPVASIERLRHFRDEEEQHFLLVKEAMEFLGADPTAQTPDADVSAVASMGVQKVVSDPRTTVPQCLDALLTAELTDHAGWELLIQLADEMGLDEFTERFRGALREEEEHLTQVREWCVQGALAQAD